MQTDWGNDIAHKIIKHISEGYAVAYVVSEDETAAIQQFADLKIPVQDYISNGSLTIVGRDTFYSPFVPSNVLLEQWSKLFASIEKRSGNGSFKGFVAAGMPADSFFISEIDNRQLVQYESLAAEKYDGSLEALCIYTTQMVQSMPLRHILSLLNAHQNTGHRRGMLREWNVVRSYSLLKQGLDAALGPHVSEMVRQMLARDIGIEEQALVSHPDELERRLELLLGQSAAMVVTSHVKTRIIDDILY
jgi:hypothetical protein